MITSHDMRTQVKRSLEGNALDGEFDVEAIVDDLKAAHGLVNIDAIPDDAYWATVKRHAL